MSSGDVKTEIWIPSHEDMEESLSEVVLTRPAGIPPPTYSPEYTPPAARLPGYTPPAALTTSDPAWTRLHAAPRENFENSPLLGLPDSLVTKIMSFTDQDSLLRLRHTSRTFMRLFSSSEEFAGLRFADGGEGAEYSANIWRTPNCTYPEQRESTLCSSVGCIKQDDNGWNCSRQNCTSEDGLKFLVWPKRDGRYELEFISFSHIPFNRGPSGEKPNWYGVFSAIHEVTNPKDPVYFLASRRFQGCDPMRMFDPSLCSCLYWNLLPSETDTNTENCFKWHLSGHTCRSWRYEADEDCNEYAGCEMTECDLETDRCHGARHGFDAYLSPGCQASIDFINCLDDSNMLVLVQRTTLIVEGPTDPNWVRLICPQTRDTEMLGKTWCYSKNCKRPGCPTRLLDLEWRLSHPNGGADSDDDEYDTEDMSDYDEDDNNEAIDSVEEEDCEAEAGTDGAIDNVDEDDTNEETAIHESDANERTDTDEDTIRTATALSSGPDSYLEQLLCFQFLLF